MKTSTEPEKMSLEQLLDKREMLKDMLQQFKQTFPLTCMDIEKDLTIIEEKIKNNAYCKMM